LLLKWNKLKGFYTEYRRSEKLCLHPWNWACQASIYLDNSFIYRGRCENRSRYRKHISMNQWWAKHMFWCISYWNLHASYLSNL